jgi:hypothetical protein
VYPSNKIIVSIKKENMKAWFRSVATDKDSKKV